MPSLKSATSYVSCSLHEPVKLRATEESLAKYKPQTIPEFFHECCEKYKHLPALTFENFVEDHSNGKGVSSKSRDATDNTWTTITYGEYERYAERAALALLYLGVGPRTSVSVMAFNCPEWFYIQMGALRINAVSAGIYTTNSPEAVFHILETSDASVVVVDDSHQLAKIRAIKSRLPQLRAVVQLHGPYNITEAERRDGYYRWSDLMAIQFNDAIRQELTVRERDVAANDCALLIFTSGTVGMPKGCMISHDGILYCSHVVTASLSNVEVGNESVASYLPLNHVAAQLFDIFMAIESGALVYFADRNALKGTLGRTFIKAKPTMLFGVPRIFEKFHEKLTQVDANSSGAMKYLMTAARDTVLQYHLDRMAGRPTSSFKYWMASKLTHRIKLALGLDRSKGVFVGGAPVTEELKRYFLSLDMPLVDVFGMSETSGGVVFNYTIPNLKTVGKPVGDVELKIREPDQNGEGEITVRSRMNFMGYLKEPEKTKATLTEDGFLLSGDLGYKDDQGNLYVSGRIKELIITAGGENIPPVHIEELIKNQLPCISNALVIGDHRKYLTVLLTFKTKIDPDTGYPLDILLPETTEWLENLGLHYTRLSEVLQIELPENLKNFDSTSVEVRPHEKIQEALLAGIKRANEEAISNAHKVQYFTVLPHDFSMPTNELGPTLKVRRNIIHKKYEKIIDRMYSK